MGRDSWEERIKLLAIHHKIRQRVSVEMGTRNYTTATQHDYGTSLQVRCQALKFYYQTNKNQPYVGPEIKIKRRNLIPTHQKRLNRSQSM